MAHNGSAHRMPKGSNNVGHM